MPRKPTSRVELRSQDEAVIVRFTDAIWLEDGLGEKPVRRTGVILSGWRPGCRSSRERPC